MQTATTAGSLAILHATVLSDKAEASHKVVLEAVEAVVPESPVTVVLLIVRNLLDQTTLLLVISTASLSSGSSLRERPSPFARNVVVPAAGLLHTALEGILGLFAVKTSTAHPPTQLLVALTSVLCQTRLPGTFPSPGKRSCMTFGAFLHLTCGVACLAVRPFMHCTALDGRSVLVRPLSDPT